MLLRSIIMAVGLFAAISTTPARGQSPAEPPVSARALASDTSALILWPGLGLLALGIGFFVVRRRRSQDDDLPYLIFPPPAAAPDSADHVARVGPLARAPDLFPPPTLYTSAPGRQPPPPMGTRHEPSADTVLEEATVQLLPGRLKILVGPEREREFRFVRSPGQVTEVTIGRKSGTGPEHLQLAAPTVSRLHARMRFEGDGWVIENLSHTNPLVINGQILAEGAQPRPLREEDRLEIGEFVLSYHER
jgi:hypothetical protein